jgi:hypothetical protein
MSAGGSIIGANAEASSLRSQAAQYEVNAGLARASSQRKAIDVVREGKLQQSRVLALVAASGAGASDPSVVNALARMAGETQYAKDVALYEGDVEGMNYEMQASARRAEARAVKTLGYMKAASTLLSAGSTMADRYGNAKPGVGNDGMGTISTPASSFGGFSDDLGQISRSGVGTGYGSDLGTITRRRR